MRHYRPTLALAIASSLAACSGIGETCNSGVVAAVAVHVTDAPSGTVPASGVTLVLHGASSDSVTTMSFGGLIQGGNRPGTYSVLVRQAGYRDFARNGVVVPSASCDQPQTARLDVVMQPL